MAADTIVLLGRSGSGKGTQCRMLRDMWGAAGVEHRYVYAGEIFRALLAEASPLGERIRAAFERGEFPSARDATDILLRPLADLKVPARSLVLYDGSPRRLEEAKSLDARLIAMGRDPALAVLIDVPAAKCFDRLLARGRADDTEEKIRVRLREFEANTVPVIEHYRADGRLLAVNGDQAPEKIFQDILSALRAEYGVYE